MIPIKLTIEGVYSYQERHTVDFEKLTSAGLFGIFGPVGSGKSSILEAITFALYADTERLNARGDNRHYNMMNLKSNRSLFDFEFYNHKNEKFKIVREYRRNSKQFEEVSQKSAICYRWAEGHWLPLDHIDVEKIIGLSYTNFKRTIIIPQGRFREFIELSDKERTDMLKEIFDLHRFDLGSKARSLASQTKSEIDVLTGNLHALEEITQEQLEEMTVLRHEKGHLLSLRSNLYKIKSAEVQVLQLIQKDIEQLEAIKKELAQLDQQKLKIEELKTEVAQFQQVEKYFKYPLLSLREKEKQSTEITDSLQKEKEVLDELQKKGQLIHADLTKWTKPFEQLEQTKQEHEYLKALIEIKKREVTIAELTRRSLKGTQLIAAKEKETLKLTTTIADKEALITNLKQHRINTTELIDISHWFAELKRIEDHLSEIERQQQIYLQEKDKISIFFTNHKLSPLNWERALNEKKKQHEEKLNSVQNELNRLHVQQQLAHFTNQLEDGKPCPLCGSEEHPHIMKTQTMDNELLHCQKQIKKFKEAVDNIQTLYNSCAAESGQLAHVTQELEQRTQLYKQQASHLTFHQEMFMWPEYDRSDKAGFERKKQRANEVEEQIELIQREVQQLRTNFETARQEIEVYKKGIENISNNIRELKALNTAELNRTSQGATDTTSSHLPELEQTFVALGKQIIETNNRYTAAQEQHNRWKIAYATQQQTVHLLSTRQLALFEEMKAAQRQVHNLLHAHDFQSVTAVETILQKDLNTTQINKTVQQFEVSRQSLYNNMNELQKKLRTTPFDAYKFAKAMEELEHLDSEIRTLTGECASLDTQTKQLGQQLQTKQKLTTKKEKLDTRLANINTLVSLFRSSGFVNFASSIWLKNIVLIANERFHRMTRNQLSLQLSDDNNIEVIDYLNEGKRRNIKTLSGGQAFQVSLSLALALAESVQTLSTSDKNFFFIDEGFGTQDIQSINVVFETLNNLNKENRIVGIISHVEELQERIPASLHVTKHTERGSLITTNFT